jgi:hypothetical protein
LQLLDEIGSPASMAQAGSRFFGLVTGGYLPAALAANWLAAAYLPTVSEQRNPSDYTPELSRRARGVEVWAALRSALSSAEGIAGSFWIGRLN